VFIFGPNNLVTPEGYWSCESRTLKRQFLWYFHMPFYDRMFPGPKPAIDYKTENLLLRTDNLKDTDVEQIDMPVFLATPLEPPIWGRWIVTVAQKVMQYKEYGAGRKFMCHVAHDWQRAFLRLLGVKEGMILAHDPGRTYICRDVMTVEYSVTNMTVSAMERTNFFGMIANYRVKIERKRKVFVSHLSRARQNPNYRGLQNEMELASMLEELGFTTIEPETLPLEEQISIFAAAEQVVFLGGSGVFNAAFCAPDTSVVTIESSDTYIGHHTEFLASLGLRYGVIFGKEDPEDRSDSHKRWTIDVARVRDELMKFFVAD
jgi:capsular polysaccharide biosynthesis protein